MGPQWGQEVVCVRLIDIVFGWRAVWSIEQPAGGVTPSAAGMWHRVVSVQPGSVKRREVGSWWPAFNVKQCCES